MSTKAIVVGVAGLLVGSVAAYWMKPGSGANAPVLWPAAEVPVKPKSCSAEVRVPSSSATALRDESEQTGLLLEMWAGVKGTHVQDLTSCPAFPGAPSVTAHLYDLEITPKYGDSYGLRLRGWIVPPK